MSADAGDDAGVDVGVGPDVDANVGADAVNSSGEKPNSNVAGRITTTSKASSVRLFTSSCHPTSSQQVLGTSCLRIKYSSEVFGMKLS